MEILGLDPKITICKIAVLPVKLYPLYAHIKGHSHPCTHADDFLFYCIHRFVVKLPNPTGTWTQDITVKTSCLNHLTIGSDVKIFFFIQETTWTFTKINQRSLSSPCLPIPALGLKKKKKDKARMIWTLIWAIMSSLLYQLSYSLYLYYFYSFIIIIIKDYTP